MAVAVLVASILIQAAAAALALRLAWTARCWAWVVIALAVSLMTLRRCVTLYIALVLGRPINLAVEGVAFAISALMLSGVIGLRTAWRSVAIADSAAVGEDLLAPRTARRLSQTALFLGAVCVVGSAGVGAYAWRASGEATVANISRYNLSLVRSMRRYALQLAAQGDRANVLRGLATLWSEIEPPDSTRYLCASLEDGSLALHTLDADKVGRNIGACSVNPIDSDHTLTLSELMAERTDRVGWFVSLTGERQIGAFAFVPGPDILIGVHVPGRSVEAEVWATEGPWTLGIAAITGVILPLSIGFLHRAYAASHRSLVAAHDALAESEERQRLILQSTLDPIITTDAHGTIRSASTSVQALFGWTAEELVGQNVSVLMPEPHRSEHDSYLERYRRTGEARSIGVCRELRGRHRGGTTFPCEVSISVTELPNREPLFTRIVRDISGRKNAETALREERDRAERYFDAAKVIMLVLDADQRVARINAEGCTILGRSKHDIVGQNWFDVFLPERDREIVRARFVEIMAGRRAPASNYENTVVTAGGEERLIAWSNTLLRDNAGRIRGTLSSGGDISARKKAEEELRESEERFRQLAENMHQVIWLTDWVDKKLLFVSPSYETVFGEPCEQLYKNRHGWIDLIREEERDRIARVFARNADLGVITDEEYQIVRRDGTTRWVRDCAYPLRDESGTIYRIIGIAEDITDRKRAEEDAAQWRDELAHVARRNMMGEMISGIAHELSQPLSAILTYTQGCARRLRDGGASPVDLTEAMDRAAEQAKRAGEIIRRIRDFVKPSAPVRATQNLNDLVREVMAMFTAEVRDRRIDVRMNLENPPPTAEVDRIQIQQVVTNLVRNAIDAMTEAPTGERTLTLATRMLPADAVEVNVSDTGSGVSPAVRDQLFDPFFTTKPDGMGIGLSISRSIVETHDGRLDVDAGAAAGATFRFTLPTTTKETGDADRLDGVHSG